MSAPRQASPKQIAANRRNAKKSTGPRTLEGKRNSSLNARRHSLTAQVSLMPEADRAAHDAFCRELVESFQPGTPMERQLAQSIATDQWRLNRMRAIEDNILALGGQRKIEATHPEIDAAMNMAMAFLDDPHRFQLISLYIQRTSRELHRNLQLLQKMQSERRAIRQQALDEALRLREASAERSMPFDRKSYPTLITEITAEKSPTGFEFSPDEIDAFGFYVRNVKAPPTRLRKAA